MTTKKQTKPLKIKSSSAFTMLLLILKNANIVSLWLFLWLCFIFIHPPHEKSFGTNKSVLSTFNIHNKTFNLESFSLTWDEVFDPHRLAISFLLLHYFTLLTFPGSVALMVTSEEWPVAPRGRPPRWPRAGPGHRGASVIPPDKRANIPCSPLMSPAKRTGSTLGPLGFIYPFLFGPAKTRPRRQVGQVPFSCDRLTTSRTHGLSRS